MTVCNREGLFLLFEKIHCHSLSGAVTLENFNYSTVFLFIHIPSIWSFKGCFFCGKLDAAALKNVFQLPWMEKLIPCSLNLHCILSLTRSFIFWKRIASDLQR